MRIMTMRWVNTLKEAEDTGETKAKARLVVKGVTREQVLKLETVVCGLRNAPKALWKRVVRDLTETGWVQHQLDQCTFMFMNGTELVGLTGVYVDDFLFAGCDDDPIFSAALSKLKGTFSMENVE